MRFQLTEQEKALLIKSIGQYPILIHKTLEQFWNTAATRNYFEMF